GQHVIESDGAAGGRLVLGFLHTNDIAGRNPILFPASADDRVHNSSTAVLFKGSATATPATPSHSVRAMPGALFALHPRLRIQPAAQEARQLSQMGAGLQPNLIILA